MSEKEFEVLSGMFDSKDYKDIILAEEIFCNMNLNEIAWYLTYHGRKNQYKNSLPPRSFEHLQKLTNNR